ncbi:hypothetical protein [Chloroflexus sp.]|uniref:hypothetical protein n=1 Tax=Chloroflexus sp. TaxID=1904827 RepID=UPI00262E5186|nr:hypothetical protein [uncultured Chloroflexus sp.]
MLLAGLLALVIYPGGLLALGLGLGYRLLATRQLPEHGSLILTREWIGWIALATLALIAGGLTGLPWPWHPSPFAFGWAGAWVLLELAAWLLFWPMLTAGTPHLVRAAVREAQIGMLGRAMLWGVAAIGFSGADALNVWSLGGHLLLLLAGLVILPAAINWGPFGPEPSLSPRGILEGLPARSATTLTFARDTLAAALISVVWLAGLPTTLLPPFIALLIIFGGSAITITSLSWLHGRLPRLSVPAAIRAIIVWGGIPAVLAMTMLSQTQGT